MSVPDIDIITRHGRDWASLHANTPLGRDWITRYMDRREGSVTATIPSHLTAEYFLLIKRCGAVARIGAA